MSDDLKDRGPADRARISLQEEHEVQYWTKALRVTRAQLEKAVKAVGHSAEAVRNFLKKGGG